MSLSTELLNFLDDTGEPLKKRIKIADNALNSSDLPLQHKEVILLTWALKNNKVDTINLVINWLKSEHFKYLNRNDLCYDNIEEIIQLILKALKRSDEKTNILELATLLLEIQIFEQYFKSNLETYCHYIVAIIKKIKCPDQFCKFIKSKFVFPKTITSERTFYSHFLSICLPRLLHFSHKSQNETQIFQAVSEVVQHCIFYRNFKNFEAYVNKFFNIDRTEETEIPKALFKHLVTNSDTEEISTLFKLVFHALFTAYNDFDIIYKSLILLCEMIGFDCKSLYELKKVSKLHLTEISPNNTFNVFLAMLEVLNENKTNVDHVINDVKFTAFIQKIILAIMNASPPTETIYKILQKAISLDPLIVEANIQSIIEYSLLADNSEHNRTYAKFFITVFEIYEKLHRIPNFISKLIPTVKAVLEGTHFIKEELNFRGDKEVCKLNVSNLKVDEIFPIDVTEYFGTCVTTLASWQIINLFKTLLFHLNSAVEELQNNTEPDANFVLYMEILSKLIGSVLSSVRIAEHTTSQNVVDKFVTSLNDMKTTLKHFGKTLLNREHNEILVRAFLYISYYWAEIHIIINYYSPSENIIMNKPEDTNYTACNITYLHTYLNIKQWCHLSERITNFGDKPCKELMQKLFIQRLKAYSIFEESLNDSIVQNIANNLEDSVNDNWKGVVLNQFAIEVLLPKFSADCLLNLSENILNQYDSLNKMQKECIMESLLLIKSINYVIVKRMNKSLKQKKQEVQPLSCKIFSKVNGNSFLKGSDSSLVELAKTEYNSVEDSDSKQSYRINEDKTLKIISSLKQFSLISCSENILKFYLIYFFAVHKDVAEYQLLKENIETIIIGLLQHVKFGILTLFDPRSVCIYIIENFDRFETVFELLIDNSVKYMKQFSECVSSLITNMETPNYLKSAMIYLNCFYKLKKVKLPNEIRNLTNELKTNICNTMLKIVLKKGVDSERLEPCGHVLKHILSLNETNDEHKQLLTKLPVITEYAFDNSTKSAIKGSLLLFATILNNKSKLDCVDDDFIMKVWNWLKQLDVSLEQYDEYSQLISLEFSLISNEKFSEVTNGFLNITLGSLNASDDNLLIKQLKGWEGIVGCNFNQLKIGIWQETLESLLQAQLEVLKVKKTNIPICHAIVEFCNTLVKSNQLLLTQPMIDMLLLLPSILSSNTNENFFESYEMTIMILESLIKFRKPLMMDRLPAYLQHYGLLMGNLCSMSNSDKNDSDETIKKLADCAHLLEKLTKVLVDNKKDMIRMAMYLIADILMQYETITLYVHVKVHLNNCVYSLISLCDQHAISFLMRVLSSASTELFKIMYDHYKKYYKFSGKV